MKLRDLGEDAFIEQLRVRTPAPSHVRVGIGDDAAVLMATPGGKYRLLTTDMLVEGVHFRSGERDAKGIGHKALAVSVSDIAAMGGIPREAVVSVGAPPHVSVRFLNGIVRGIEGLAHRSGTVLVGGDLVRAPCLVINVALSGEVKKRELVTRSGARPGDVLWVTGSLGGNFRGRVLRIQPRLEASRKLVRYYKPTAMMDLSDGLWTDLGRLCRASRVRARVDLERLPVHPAARRQARYRGMDPYFAALSGGEDFELLFTLSPRVSRRLAGKRSASLGVAARRIGEITRFTRTGSRKKPEVDVHQNGHRIGTRHVKVWKHF